MLRAETAPLHRELDDSGTVMRALHGPKGLAQAVAGQWRIHDAFERCYADLSLWHDIGLPFSPRRKSPLLHADLSALQARGIEAPPLPAADIVLPAGNAEAALGAMYVLEGSTLGGVHIARAILDRHGFTSAFYGCYGTRTAAMWKSFQQALLRYGEQSPDTARAVIDGANAMFALHLGLFRGIGE